MSESQQVTIEVTALADVEPEQVRWLWSGYVPLGKLTLLDGDPGVGKSTVALDLASRISTGRPMPDGTTTDLGTVILLTAEDGLSDTVRPRLEVAGANLDRIRAVTGLRDLLTDEWTPISLPGAIVPLWEGLQELEPSLVIVDPLAAYLGSEVNTWRDHDVRRALSPLKELAEILGSTILAIRYLTKGPGGQALYRGGGSIGIIGAARAAFLIARDPGDREQRVLAPVKMNLGPMPPAFRFRLEPVEHAARIVWEGASDVTADRLLAGAQDEEERTLVEEAQEFLLDRLQHGSVFVAELTREARDMGLSSRTLRRAQSSLAVRSERDGFGGKVRWSLPTPHSGPTPHTGHTHTIGQYEDRAEGNTV